jgi:membrane associated rhomboid family serine protease
MFSELFTNRQITPLQTYVIILCSLGVTVATIFFSNLENVFGSFGTGTTFINRLTLVFQHGFDHISAIIHLVIDCVFLFIFGSFLEKTIGPFYFFLLNLYAFAVYILLHQVLFMTGHGASGIICAYIPPLLYILNEGRILKPRSVFDEIYRILRNLIMLVLVLFPLLLAIIPIYFDSEAPLWRAIILGNIFPIAGLLTGIGFIYLYKRKIFERLKQFARKKKFDISGSAKYPLQFIIIYPLLVIAGFLLLRL